MDKHQPQPPPPTALLAASTLHSERASHLQATEQEVHRDKRRLTEEIRREMFEAELEKQTSLEAVLQVFREQGRTVLPMRWL